jgi:adenine specific DNA methylase Mod
VELQHVLKPTGSIYLHCDPTASHYLKMLMDAVFGPVNFVNEVIWKRTAAHSDAKQGATHFGRVHDVLLFYQKEPQALFHAQWVPYDQEYIESHYRYVEESTGRRYRKDNLTANRPGGDTLYEWNGVGPYKGRY